MSKYRGFYEIEIKGNKDKRSAIFDFKENGLKILSLNQK